MKVGKMIVDHTMIDKTPHLKMAFLMPSQTGILNEPSRDYYRHSVEWGSGSVAMWRVGGSLQISYTLRIRQP